jgi:hypothetical protein
VWQVIAYFIKGVHWEAHACVARWTDEELRAAGGKKYSDFKFAAEIGMASQGLWTAPADESES